MQRKVNCVICVYYSYSLFKTGIKLGKAVCTCRDTRLCVISVHLHTPSYRRLCGLGVAGYVVQVFSSSIWGGTCWYACPYAFQKSSGTRGPCLATTLSVQRSSNSFGICVLWWRMEEIWLSPYFIQFGIPKRWNPEKTVNCSDWTWTKGIFSVSLMLLMDFSLPIAGVIRLVRLVSVAREYRLVDNRTPLLVT